MSKKCFIFEFLPLFQLTVPFNFWPDFFVQGIFFDFFVGGVINFQTNEFVKCCILVWECQNANNKNECYFFGIKFLQNYKLDLFGKGCSQISGFLGVVLGKKFINCVPALELWRTLIAGIVSKMGSIRFRNRGAPKHSAWVLPSESQCTAVYLCWFVRLKSMIFFRSVESWRTRNSRNCH